jgi:hypothetical protein
MFEVLRLWGQRLGQHIGRHAAEQKAITGLVMSEGLAPILLMSLKLVAATNPCRIPQD